ncbi:MAG: hypothetical protein ABSF85_00790 [Terriglobales bacterium]
MPPKIPRAGRVPGRFCCAGKVHQLPLGGVCNATANTIEFLRLDPCWQRPPTVTVSEQNDEVRLDAGLLAALNLAQADLHGLLVECRLVAHTPAQVNGLEACAVLFTELGAAWETSRSAFMPENVELTKRRMVRRSVGMAGSAMDTWLCSSL